MLYNVLKDAKTITNSFLCRYDSLAGYDAGFDQNGDVSGWDVYNNIYLYGCWNGVLFGTSYDRSCYISRTTDFSYVEAEDYYEVQLMLKLTNNSGKDGRTTGRIQWTTTNDSTWTEDKQLDFDVIDDDDWHLYKVNMGPAQWWQGNINNLRVYPFVDGWKKDQFAIKMLRIMSVNNRRCLNTSCSYYSQYEYPCSGGGQRGYIESGLQKQYFTTVSGVNDTLSISIDGYGYEQFELGTNRNISGVDMAKLITLHLGTLSIGGYAFATVGYDDYYKLRITSGTMGGDSTIRIANTPASVELGFYDEYGNAIYSSGDGIAPADGFDYESSRLLSSRELMRLYDGDTTELSYIHDPNQYSVEGGRSDYIDVGTSTLLSTVNGVGSEYGYDYESVSNVSTTLIDVSHPFNNNGRIDVINFFGSLGEDPKIKLLRPRRNGTFMVIDSVDVDLPSESKHYSALSNNHKVDCEFLVNKGDCLGFYDIDMYIGLVSGERPDATFYQISGEVSGAFDPGFALSYGIGGFPFYAHSNRLQSDTVLEIDFGKRVNISEVSVYGEESSSYFEFNLASCLDLTWEVDLYGGSHKHRVTYAPNSETYVYTHENVYYGKECLDDMAVSLDGGQAGDTTTNDSTGLVTIGTHTYFYVNGDAEWGYSSDCSEPAEFCGNYILNSTYEFETDPVSLTLYFPYEFSCYIHKTKFYFKESDNFRDFGLSYYLGAGDTSGNAEDVHFEYIPEFTAVETDGTRWDDDNKSSVEEYLFANPTQSKLIYINGEVSNYDQYVQQMQCDWTTLVHEFDPILCHGFRMYCSRHHSTKIIEAEVYSKFNTGSSLLDNIILSFSDYGEIWRTVGFDNDGDGIITAQIGGAPRYFRVELNAQTKFTLSEMLFSVGDDVILEKCEDTLLLGDVPPDTYGSSYPIVITNNYGQISDLTVDIPRNFTKDSGTVFWSKLSSESDIDNPSVGPGCILNKGSDYVIGNASYQCAINTPSYGLKNLVHTKKYYTKENELPWEYKGTVSSGVSVDFCNLPDVVRADLTFRDINNKYIKIGVFDDVDYFSLETIHIYYDDVEITPKYVYVQADPSVSSDKTEASLTESLSIENALTFSDDFEDQNYSSWDVGYSSTSTDYLERYGGFYVTNLPAINDYVYIEKDVGRVGSDFILEFDHYMERIECLQPRIRLYFLDDEDNTLFTAELWHLANASYDCRGILDSSGSYILGGCVNGTYFAIDTDGQVIIEKVNKTISMKTLRKSDGYEYFSASGEVLSENYVVSKIRFEVASTSTTTGHTLTGIKDIKIYGLPVISSKSSVVLGFDNAHTVNKMTLFYSGDITSLNIWTSYYDNNDYILTMVEDGLPSDPALYMDSYTRLLLHMEMATLGDSSSYAQSITKVGNVTRSTNYKKFGDYSAYFDGGGDRLTVASDSSLYLGTDDFTIDFWVFPINGGHGGTWARLVQFGNNSTNGGLWIVCCSSENPTRIRIDTYTGSYQSPIAYSDTTLPNTTWTHVALVRKDGSFYLYFDGISVGSSSAYTSYEIILNPIYIGTNNTSGESFYGYIDEMRISVGVARWDGEFTPPSSKYTALPIDTSVFYSDAIDIENTTYNNYLAIDLEDNYVLDLLRNYGSGSDLLWFSKNIETEFSNTNTSLVDNVVWGNSDYSDARWMRVFLLCGDGVARCIEKIGVFPDIETYLRPNGGYNCDWDSFDSNFLTIYNASINYLLNATLSGSSGYVFYGAPTYAYDGIYADMNTDACWIFTQPDTDNPYLEFDMGESKSINLIKVYNGYDYNDTDGRITEFKLYGSTTASGEDFYEILSETSVDAYDFVYYFDDISARRVKFEVTDFNEREQIIVDDGSYVRYNVGYLRELVISHDDSINSNYVDSEDYPIIALNLRDHFNITGHDLITLGEDVEDLEWDADEEFFRYSSANTNDVRKVSFSRTGKYIAAYTKLWAAGETTTYKNYKEYLIDSGVFLDVGYYVVRFQSYTDNPTRQSFGILLRGNTEYYIPAERLSTSWADEEVSVYIDEAGYYYLYAYNDTDYFANDTWGIIDIYFLKPTNVAYDYTPILSDNFSGTVLDTTVWGTNTVPNASVTVDSELRLNNFTGDDHSGAQCYTKQSFDKSDAFAINVKWKPTIDDHYDAGEGPSIKIRSASNISRNSYYGTIQTRFIGILLSQGGAFTTERTAIRISEQGYSSTSVIGTVLATRSIDIDESEWQDLSIHVDTDTREVTVYINDDFFSTTITEDVWDSIGDTFVVEFGTSEYRKTNTETFKDFSINTLSSTVDSGFKWVAIVRDTAENHSYNQDEDLNASDRLHKIKIYGESAYAPTEYYWWWNTSLSELSNSVMHTKVNNRSLRIDYPTSSGIDVLEFIEGDTFGDDGAWSIQDSLAFWLFTESPYLIDMNYFAVTFGDINSDDPAYYTWNVTESLNYGWNRLVLPFTDATSVYPSEEYDSNYLDSSLDFRTNETDFKSFKLQFKGTGSPFTMYIDDLRIKRNTFDSLVKFNYGLFLSGSDYLTIPINEVSLERGSMEFWMRFCTNGYGRDAFGIPYTRYLFTLSNNANDIITFLISVGEGLRLIGGSIRNQYVFPIDQRFSDIILRDQVFHFAIVWSNDGSATDNGDTLRFYINGSKALASKYTWDVNDTKQMFVKFGGGGTQLSYTLASAFGAMFIENVKIYDFCKDSFDANDYQDEVELVDPSEFLQLSDNDVDFYSVGNDNLPLVFKEIVPGGSKIIYVRSNRSKDKKMSGCSGNILIEWAVSI